MVGAATAYRLSRAGADTTLIERGGIGAGTSAATFSVNITTRKTPREYYDLSLRGVQEHRRLAQELDGYGRWLHPIPAHEWGESEHERALIAGRVHRLREWGYPAEWVTTARLRAEEPRLAVDRNPHEEVARYSDEAWYDAPAMARQLAVAAHQHGARVHTHTTVTGLLHRNGRITAVSTYDGDEVPADVVINCAGPAAGDIAQLAGAQLPLLRAPGLVATTAPLNTPPLRSIVLAPTVNIRPTADGRVLLHSFTVDARLAADPTPERSEEHAADLMSRARNVLPTLHDAALEDQHVGIRPLPADGMPILGWLPDCPNMYVVASHSAVHLAPILSQLATTEILTGHETPELSAYRPDRPSLEKPATSALDESTRQMSLLFSQTTQ